MSFRVALFGLGVQGQKRRRVAGPDIVATIDPTHPEADLTTVDELDPARFDAALLCIPDAPKLALVERLLGQGKHVLVEKPLFAAAPEDLERLEALAARRGAVCYTAYNHRFEPHLATLRDLVREGGLGRIYRARFFYGNGTARDVRNSAWRDAGAGVLPDLGSHLLDLLLFLFDAIPADLRIWSARRFENRSFDHVIAGADGRCLVELELSLLSWRNDFVAELYGEAGSAHVESLCKWGPSTLTVRRRRLPSGRPEERAETLVQPDPTWALEYGHFKSLCAAGGAGNLANDRAIDRALRQLVASAGAGTGGA